MDEVLFRGSQKLEAIQIQAHVVASKTKELLQIYSQSIKALLQQIGESNKLENLKQNVAILVSYIIQISKDFKERAIDVADPKRLWLILASTLGGRWSKREITILCTGFAVGGLVGVAVGLALRKQEKVARYMEAIQVNHYLGIEAAQVVEDALAPYECGDYDVLINVKAASVQIIDAQICSGYGKTYRRILRRLNNQPHLPVILGRDCTGIITDMGKKVKNVEIGDEVWVTVPYWSQGTLCQTVLVSENRISRKPKNVGFEGSCSIPYAGSVALSFLADAGVDDRNAHEKRFLIHDGCTPVGCVLIQVLSGWNAHVTTTCYKRAIPVAKALGANEIISIDADEMSSGDHAPSPDQEISKALYKELEIRGNQFDVIFITRNESVDWNSLSMFCKRNGRILSTFPENLLSDSCGYFSRLVLAGYVRLKLLLQNTIGFPQLTFDEAHLCHNTLSRLAEMVENGELQTVVEKVFSPKDIDLALNHIQSPKSVGSTVISFR